VAARSGGGTVRVRELASSLARVGSAHRYLFVVRHEMSGAVAEHAPAAEILSPPGPFQRTPARLLWEHLRLPRIASSWRPDVVLSPFNILPVRWPEPRPKLVLIVSNLAPYAINVRRMYRGKERLRLEVLRLLTDRSLLRADRVFLLSAQAFDLIDPGILDGHAEIIPMAPPSPTDGPISPALTEPFFLIACDLLRYKGIELAIQALAAIKDLRTSLLVCGNALDARYARELREQALGLGLGERVRFLGSLDHNALLGLLGECIACIVPSRFENKSRVPVEAMAMRAPVIASRLRTFQESCGEAALYFDLDHPHPQLAEHMNRLIHDDDLRNRLRRAAGTRLLAMQATDATERILASIEQLAAASA
jgi:glycosyltransferase involved in cell wall biosynthesis